MKTAQGYDIHRHLCALVTIKSSLVGDPILHRAYLTIIHLFRSADEHFFLEVVSNDMDDDASQIIVSLRTK